MKLINFKDKNMEEIDFQDNPLTNGEKEECFLVIKSAHKLQGFVPETYMLFHINPAENIPQLEVGIFYSITYVEKYVSLLTGEHKYCEDECEYESCNAVKCYKCGAIMED